MKILQVGASYTGAQKKIEYAIHDYCRKNGYESKIFYAIGESDDPDISCYENRFLSFIRRGLRKFLGKHSCFALLSTLKLIRKIKKYAPDIVHLHVIHHGYMYYEMLFKYLAKKRIPTVLTAHDMWFFTGGCYYYSTVGCEGFLTGCHNCPKCENELDCSRSSTARKLKKKLDMFENLNKTTFVSVSPWVYSEMKKSALSKYSQYVIMNSVDKTDYPYVLHKKNEKFTIIGVAAAWDERKGLKRFYELGEMLGNNINIILVGSVEEELKKDAPANITFYGYTKSVEELHELYSKSDLHVSMSCEETFGLTFVEAALAGIRSLGFNSTAIPAVLDKVHGYVIASCTVEDVAKKIRELIKDRDACVISEHEHQEIREYFSAERMASEYKNIYEEILK